MEIWYFWYADKNSHDFEYPDKNHIKRVEIMFCLLNYNVYQCAVYFSITMRTMTIGFKRTEDGISLSSISIERKNKVKNACFGFNKHLV